MKIPHFSKINKHRTFDYTPMYYDPVKEDLDKRVEEAKAKYGVEGADENIAREVKMRASFQESKSAMNSFKKWNSSFRMIIILGLVIYLSYVLFSNLDGFLAKILH